MILSLPVTHVLPGLWQNVVISSVCSFMKILFASSTIAPTFTMSSRDATTYRNVWVHLKTTISWKIKKINFYSFNSHDRESDIRYLVLDDHRNNTKCFYQHLPVFRLWYWIQNAFYNKRKFHFTTCHLQLN